MKSYPDSGRVLDDLGGKVVDGVSLGIARTADDLREYRRLKPSWVSGQSERGLACWIHDRIWAHLLTTLDGVSEITFRDEEPHRELFIGRHYRLRVKRHNLDADICTYPTQGALDFYLQPSTLPSLEEVRLTAGYVWTKLDRSVGEAVLSLRDGIDNVIWLVPLPVPSASCGVADIRGPVLDGPADPSIDYTREGGNETGEKAGSA